MENNHSFEKHIQIPEIMQNENNDENILGSKLIYFDLHSLLKQYSIYTCFFNQAAPLVIKRLPL